jgi:hypothetical protein
MWSQATNEPFDEDLEDGGGDQALRERCVDQDIIQFEELIESLLLRRPKIVVSQSSALLLLAWNKVMKKNGTKNAISAAA